MFSKQFQLDGRDGNLETTYTDCAVNLLANMKKLFKNREVGGEKPTDENFKDVHAALSYAIGTLKSSITEDDYKALKPSLKVLGNIMLYRYRNEQEELKKLIVYSKGGEDKMKSDEEKLVECINELNK